MQAHRLGSHPVAVEQPQQVRHRLLAPVDVEAHEAVLQAILNGDEEAAYRTMTAHISSGGNVYADAIASAPQGAPLVAPIAVAAKAKAGVATQRPAGKRRAPAKSVPRTSSRA